MPNSTDDYHDERDRFRTERGQNDYNSREVSSRDNLNGSYRDNGYNKRKRDEGENSNRGYQQNQPQRKPIDFSAPIVYTFKQWITDQEDLITPENAEIGYK